MTDYDNDGELDNDLAQAKTAEGACNDLNSVLIEGIVRSTLPVVFSHDYVLFTFTLSCAYHAFVEGELRTSHLSVPCEFRITEKSMTWVKSITVGTRLRGVGRLDCSLVNPPSLVFFPEHFQFK